MHSIILKKSPFAEGNEVVTLYTREAGKVRGVARSVKFFKSRLAFGLQELFYSDLDLARTKNIFSIIGARPINAFRNLRESEANINQSLHATELILKSTADEQPNQKLFDYYLSFLKHLDQSRHAAHPCLDFFVLKVLALVGYGINLKFCAVCGDRLADSGGDGGGDGGADASGGGPAGASAGAGVATSQQYFSGRLCGFVCANCARTKVYDHKKIPEAAYSFLLDNFDLDFDNQDTNPRISSQLHYVAESFATHILERDLKSSRFLL